MLNGVPSSDEEDLNFIEEDDHIDIQYTVKIAKCVIAQAIETARIASSQYQTHKLWYDSMASHSITNDIDLFGVKGPRENVNINILDWKEEGLTVHLAGMTVFGPMLYSDHAGGTILSAAVMNKHNTVVWDNSPDRQGDKNLVVNKYNKKIELMFDTDNESGVLEMSVPRAMYRRICNSAPPDPFTMNGVNDGVISALKADSDDFNKGLEAIHCHKCTCHTGMTTIVHTLKNNIITGIPFEEKHVRKMNLLSNGRCPCCVAGKSVKITANPRRTTPMKHIYPEMNLPDEPAERFTWKGDIDSKAEQLGMDLMFIDGSPTLVSVGRNKGYVHVVSLTSKKAGAIKRAIQLIVEDYKCHKLKVLSMFNAKLNASTDPQWLKDTWVGTTKLCNLPEIERLNSDGEAGIIDAGMDLYQEDPKSPKMSLYHAFAISGEHVSYVERMIRTIKERVESVRAGLHFQVKKRILDWLISHAVMWINVMYSKRAPKSAWANMAGDKLHYKDLTRTVFGQVVCCHRPGIVRKHDEQKGEMGLSMGTNPRQPGSIIFYSFKTGRFKTRKRFVTNIALDAAAYLPKNKEHIQGEVINRSYTNFLNKKNTFDMQEYFTDNPEIKNSELLDLQGGSEPLSQCFLQEGHNTMNKTNKSDIDIDIFNDPDEVRNGPEDRNSPDPDARIISMRAKLTNVIMAVRTGLTNSNMSWDKAEARDGEPGKVAREKIFNEIKQIIIDYNVCSPVSADMRPANFHMSHALYDWAKDKARLVIGKKAWGDIVIDYGVDIASPTVNGKLINLMLSICIENDMNLDVWDVKGAFLKSPLNTAGVFVKLDRKVTNRMLSILKKDKSEGGPEKYNKWFKCQRKDGTMMVEAHKGWYGLCAASALWYEEISKTMTEAGWVIHSLDRCLFSKQDNNGDQCYVMLHVDDMGVIMKPNSPEKHILKNLLELKYEKLKVQDSDHVKYIGLEIKRDRTRNCFELTMIDYINKVCQIHQVNERDINASPLANPADSVDFGKSDYSLEDMNTYLNEEQITAYRSLVMSMQYATLVKPSIKFHVISLATRQARPKHGDYKKALRVLTYIRDCREKPLLIYGIGEDPRIYLYTDASFDVYKNSVSHSGMCVFIGGAGGAIHSSSRKQKSVTRSSTEAEIVSAVDALTLGQYYRNFLTELGINSKIIHYEDNMSCISLVETGCYSYDKKDRMIVRHINVMHAYFKNPDNGANMVYCNTDWHIGDGMTKDLHAKRFIVHEDVQMGHDICVNDLNG